MKTDKYFEKYLDSKFEEISSNFSLKLEKLDSKVEILTQAVMGNGKKGLYQRVEDLEGFKQYLLGTILVLSSIVGMAGSMLVDWIKKSIGLK